MDNNNNNKVKKFFTNDSQSIKFVLLGKAPPHLSPILKGLHISRGTTATLIFLFYSFIYLSPHDSLGRTGIERVSGREKREREGERKNEREGERKRGGGGARD